MDNHNPAEQSHAKEPGIRVFIGVWAALLAGTAAVVTVNFLKLGSIGNIIVLSIAAAEAAMVLLYFMHLRYEKKTVVIILIPIALVFLAICVGITMIDVLTR